MRLLLVDGHSLAYRAFHALPLESFSTSTGQATNAVYGFTSMLINTLRDERPTHAAVAFDVGRHTFRNRRFADYKANRSESPEGFAGQVDLIREVLRAMGIPTVEREDYEADDVIATLARAGESTGRDGTVLILTGDRDCLQLVDAQTTVLYPKKGVSDVERLNPSSVFAKYGVDPEQYADFAAVRGDPSDNLPKIPGVGEKTASRWIREYGTLEGLLGHSSEVPGKVGEELRDRSDQVRLNRQLTELVRDVPLGVTVDDLKLGPIDRRAVDEVFDALQFRTLRERLIKSLGNQSGVTVDSDGRVDEETAGDYSTAHASVDYPGALLDWLSSRAMPGRDARTAVAIDGTWERGHGSCDVIALAAADGEAIAFTPGDLASEDRRALADWLADGTTLKALHGAKGPVLAFADQGWVLAGLAADTEISAYVLFPGRRSFELAGLVDTLLNKSLTVERDAPGQLALDVGPDRVDGSAAARLVARARAIAELATELDRRVAAHEGTSLVREIELPLVEVLARMERNGIAVDIAHLSELELAYAANMETSEREAEAIVGRAFNLGSPKQLQQILFDERGLRRTKRIKTGWTTDADALASLAATTADPLPKVLLRWRDTAKLRQTVAGLIPLADSEGRIHTTFQQTVTSTGRLSSTDPNLQNIPVRTEAGRRIRQGFVAGAGYSSLLTADYNQIELRIMAHLSGDRGLMEAFRGGEDLHRTIAAQVFGIRREDVDPGQRRRIKAMSYGLAYGLSAFGLSQQLGISSREAQHLMDVYFLRFGGVRDYLEGIVEDARRTGYTETIMGRRRYLPDLNSDNRQRREMAERMAQNAPMQGSAADIVKVAMLHVDRALREAGMRTRLLLQVHDELICEVGPGEVDRARTLVHREMVDAVRLSVPLEVSIGVGKTWEEAAH